MRCANCGKGVFGAATICPFCRQPLLAGAPGKFLTASASAVSALSMPKWQMARWQKWTVGVFLFVGVGLALGFWLTSGLVEPVQRQLAALKRGDLQSAYAETSAGFHNTISFEKFTEFVKSQPPLSHNATFSFLQRKVNASGTGELNGTLTDDQGTVLPVQYKLVKENGTWKIFGIHLAPQR